MDSPTKRNEVTSGVSPWRRHVPAALAILLGILLSWTAFILVRDWERDNIRDKFERQAGNHAAAVREEIKHHLGLVKSIAGLYAASSKVERQEFRAFVEGNLSNHWGIQALEWIPRVRDAERAEYEEAARRDGLAAFQITERKTRSQTIRASRRDEYFPVYYIEPLEGNEAAAGFDLASNPTSLESLERARDTGEMVATARITLVQETARQYGFLVFKPVYRNGAPHDSLGERRENLTGFILGVFRIGDLVNGAFEGLDVGGIDLHVFDKTAAEGAQIIYSNDLHGGGHVRVEEYLKAEGKGELEAGLSWQTTLDVAGRRWTLFFNPKRAFLAAQRTWLEWVVFVSGLLITALTGAYLFNTSRRAAELESEVAERKQAEEALAVKTMELERSNAELSAAIGGKTRANEALLKEVAERKMAEDALRRRRVELERSNAELEQFAYSVSHDLRAPLRGIEGFSQALEEDYYDKLDAQGKDYLQRVRAASGRLAKMIDHLLNLSRLTRGEINREIVDLSAVAEAIVEEMGMSEPEREAEFVIARKAVAHCDARMIRIVLQNLLENAWKFTKNLPRARIEFGVTEDNGEPAYFVRDDGAGFNMEYTNKLFGAFQRLHTTEEFPGFGIGLATVQRIIHRHGGRVRAEGATDKGATFFFTLGALDGKGR